MTKFVKEMFETSGEYVTYFDGGDRSKFVGRFKYAKSSKASFVSFLIKNFSVEEYFSRLESKESPLTILQSKGYMQPHVKKLLKSAGYPATVAGFEKYLAENSSFR